jgi:cob(I)alamin adenosyltransferase
VKIYTRTGDRGETGLFGGQRVRKDHARVEAYGEVDELNAVVGGAVSALRVAAQDWLADRLILLQEDLFTLGANLATPAPEDGGRRSDHIPPLPSARIEQMERWIDEAEGELEPLRNFILPGGSEAATRLHLARTVCRRAERRVITLTYSAHIDPQAVIYLNRLSDLLFTWARLANHRDGCEDISWVPERGAGTERNRASGEVPGQ